MLDLDQEIVEEDDMDAISDRELGQDEETLERISDESSESLVDRRSKLSYLSSA